MRLPYLQVTQETWSKARMLAGALNLKKPEAFLLICDLWAWALDLGPKDEAPTGILISKRADALLAGAIGYEGDPVTLLEVLTDVGLVERIEGGLRVRGMGRYRRTWEKNHRNSPKPETPAEDPAPTRHQPGTNPAPQTQTQIKKKKEKKLKSIAATAVAEPPPPVNRLSASLVADYAERRVGEKYLHRGAKDTEALKALKACGASDAEIRTRWRYGIVAKGWLYISTFTQLRDKWNDLAGYGSPAPEPPPPVATQPPLIPAGFEEVPF